MGSNIVSDLDVVVVGGGITGIITALGLLRRGIKVRVYERVNNFHEIGAGLGFSANAEMAMKVVDPRVHTAFKTVATQNASDWFQYVDGEHDGEGIKLLFKLYLGERGFEGCSRPDYLDELGKLLPGETVQFGKELVSAQPVQKGDNKRMELVFADGRTVIADLGIYLALRVYRIPGLSVLIDCQSLVAMGFTPVSVNLFLARTTQRHMPITLTSTPSAR
jgi:salicylate hydroxylase